MMTTRAKHAAQHLLRGRIKNLVSRGNSLAHNLVEVNARIDALYAKNMLDAVPIGTKLSRGIHLDQDPENPRHITALSPADSLLQLKASENLGNRWTALHFVLGPLNLTAVDVLGITIRSQSNQNATVSRVCLRSGTANKFRDHFFEKHLVSSAEPGLHFDFCDLRQCTDIPLTSQWRDLIIFFAPHEVNLKIEKVRVFAA